MNYLAITKRMEHLLDLIEQNILHLHIKLHLPIFLQKLKRPV